METLQNENWIKWVHWGVPDEEGEKREKIRDRLEARLHCKICTALSGCYFVNNIKPLYPLHPHCDCEIHPSKKPDDISIIDCAITNFTEYIFTNQKTSKGKYKKFINMGYKEADCAYLKGEYEKKVREKYLSGDYSLHNLDKYGQRITIVITLSTPTRGDIMIKTGWLVHPLGKLTCATPFSGEVKSN